MSKKHDAVFDDVLSGLGNAKRSTKPEKTSNRFLKRGTALSEKIAGDYAEKTHYLVDPARCKMWAEHNRAYDLLTAENCADLIEGIKAQGKQEFPAIVRKVEGDPDYDYEVICGARRHFAIRWLRENNYTEFKYQIEPRDLSDEEAFRLADLENRERADISDFERATDYARAIKLYYDGKQSAMAKRLQVSEGWLSRYLFLAKLPKEIIAAYPSQNHIKEIHARNLKALLAQPKVRAEVIKRAIWLRDMRAADATTDGQPWNDPIKVLAELKRAGQGKAQKRKARPKFVHTYKARKGTVKMLRQDKGKMVHLEFAKDINTDALEEMMNKFISDLKGKEG